MMKGSIYQEDITNINIISNICKMLLPSSSEINIHWHTSKLGQKNISESYNTKKSHKACFLTMMELSQQDNIEKIPTYLEIKQPTSFFLIINVFFIGVQLANIQNNTQCSFCS